MVYKVKSWYKRTIEPSLKFEIFFPFNTFYDLLFVFIDVKVNKLYIFCLFSDVPYEIRLYGHGPSRQRQKCSSPFKGRIEKIHS